LACDACVDRFYERWKQTEAMHAEMLQFSLDEDQWEQDWAIILSIASQPGLSSDTQQLSLPTN